MLWVGAGNAASKVMMFVANVWIANRLLTEGYGAVSVAFVVVNYISLFLFSGLDTVTTRSVAETEPQDLGALTGQLFAARAVFVLVALALSVVASFLLSGTTGQLTRVYALSFIPQAIYSVNLYYGVEWARPVALYFVGGRLIYLGLVLWLVRDSSSAVWVPIAFGVSILIENVYLATLWLKRFGMALRHALARFDWQRWRGALPVSVAAAGLLLHENAALIVLYALDGKSTAGLYAASFRLVYIAISLTTLLSYILLARLTRVRRESRERACALFNRLSIYAVAGGLVFAVLGLALAGVVVGTIYRPEYAASASLLRLAVWQMVAAPVRVLAFQTLNACHAHRIMLPRIYVTVLLSVAAIVAGTVWLGPQGAVLGTVAGEALIAVVLWLTAWQVTAETSHAPLVNGEDARPITRDK
jgi:O-antigen/teichoic acid export membrane protein